MTRHLEGKTFVVTGATSGIGLAVAEALVQGQAAVIGIGRTAERCSLAQQRLLAMARPGALVAYLAADLALQFEVRQLSGKIGETLEAWGHAHLDVLINNAATVPFWQTFTAEGIDMQWAVNHLAPFLLTMQLLPLLKAAPAARVITVSSASHYGTHLNWEDLQLRRNYTPLRAYAQTKLGNVLFSIEFNRRYASHTGMRAFAVDPGLVNTEIGSKSNSGLARWIWGWRRRGGVLPAQAAKGILFLAVDASIQDSGAPYWKNGCPKLPSSAALNPQSARQLWQLSAQMCGIGS